MASKRGRGKKGTRNTSADLPEPEYEIESIEGKKFENGKLLYLIKWKDYGP